MLSGLFELFCWSDRLRMFGLSILRQVLVDRQIGIGTSNGPVRNNHLSRLLGLDLQFNGFLQFVPQIVVLVLQLLVALHQLVVLQDKDGHLPFVLQVVLEGDSQLLESSLFGRVRVLELFQLHFIQATLIQNLHQVQEQLSPVFLQLATLLVDDRQVQR